MLSVTLLPEGSTTLVEGGEELIDRPGLKWIDVANPSETLMARLQAKFGLHTLAVEDALHLDQRPKLEQYPNHWFLVLHGFELESEDVCDLALNELHFFIGADWVITAHEKQMAAIGEARRRFNADPKNTFARGPDFIAYVLADALVDSQYAVLDSIDDAIENLEEKIFEEVEREQLERMFDLKRTLVTVRRILSPQRDVLAVLTHGGGFVQERTALYFRDVYDHLIRVHERIEDARDLVANARDAYLSMLANRTNDITKQLTIFATIFLPLSFITGFFGQNFEEIQSPAWFWAMVVMILLLPVLLIAWFRYKRWI